MSPRTAAHAAPEAARFFLALSDPTRLTLLDRLREGEKTVGELVAALACPQPKISRHLKVLKEAGLVRDRRDGRRVHYVLTTPASWAGEARAWVERLDTGLVPQEMLPRRPGPKRARKARKAAPTRPAPRPETKRPEPDDLEDFLL